jgi:AraC-like DNA-binding protein
LGELINDQNPTKIHISSNDNRYSELMSTLDSVSTVHERAKLIEQFFISIYKQFDDRLIREVLNNFTFHEKLSTIAKRSATTTKTMDRLFNAHIGITPVQFKNILQFRNSLRTKLNNMKQSLASLSFESHYNDLPYMLRVYRKFTGMTGTAFFNSLSTSADGKYLYREVS